MGTCETVTVTLRDREGVPLVLESTDKFCLIGKAMWGDAKLLLNIDGVIVNAAAGQVSFTFKEKNLTFHGTLVGEIIITRKIPVNAVSSSSSADSSSSSAAPVATTDKIIGRSKLYIDIMESVENADSSLKGLSIMEVRFALRDICPASNFLLDDVEFSNREIAWAIRRPIDLWNDTPPPLGRYTPTTFPFRYYWTVGAVAELLQMASLHYGRNNLTYNAAGLAVNDKDKGASYLQTSAVLKGEYKQWMMHQKKSLNLENAYGSTYIDAFGNFPTGRSRS